MRKAILITALICLLSAGKCCAQYFSIKTNAVTLAAGTINLQLEAATAKKWSVSIGGYFNPINTPRLQSRIRGLKLGTSYWMYECYAGHYLSGHLSAAWYNVGNRTRYRVGNAFGIGLSYGYSWVITKRWSLWIEAGAGVYYCTDRRRLHHPDDIQPEPIRHSRRLMLIPDMLGVGFSYLF